MTVEFLEDFRSEFQSKKQMTVELLKTFDQNSSRKSIWPWNSKRLSIRIPFGRTNDCVILKDFQSEFQSEKQPAWNSDIECTSLFSNNNNNEDKPDNEADDSNTSSSGEIKEELNVKSSSIADLRMKAKRHQEALGINDSD